MKTSFEHTSLCWIAIFILRGLSEEQSRAPLTDFLVKGKPQQGRSKGLEAAQAAAEVARRKARQRPRLCRAHTQYVSPPLMPFSLRKCFCIFAAVGRLFCGISAAISGLLNFPTLGSKCLKMWGRISPLGKSAQLAPYLRRLIFPLLGTKCVAVENATKQYFRKCGEIVLPLAVEFSHICFCPTGAPLRGIVGHKKINPKQRTIPSFFFNDRKSLYDIQAQTHFWQRLCQKSSSLVDLVEAWASKSNTSTASS